MCSDVPMIEDTLGKWRELPDIVRVADEAWASETEQTSLLRAEEGTTLLPLMCFQDSGAEKRELHK